MWFALVLLALVALLIADYALSGYGRARIEFEARRELKKSPLERGAGGWFGGR